MKVICINDKVKVSTGLFSSEMRNDGTLTFGKIYQVAPVALVDNFFNQTTINISNYKFMLYNDKGQWVCHSPERFKPE